MKRFFKSAFRLILLLLFVGCIAATFPVTAEFFDRVPYWLLYPLRVCAAIFLMLMFFGYLIDRGFLQRLFGRK